ncbi:hypothetical protein [Cupriavidus basilensis]|nr:hypothetical protein [Cupriavidus basilensis]
MKAIYAVSVDEDFSLSSVFLAALASVTMVDDRAKPAALTSPREIS